MKKIFFSLAALLLLCSCEYTGPVVDTSGSGCQSGIAQIGIGDGFIEYLCGCTGQPASGTILYAPANLTCHIPAGTSVVFQYIAIHNQHQIVYSGGNFFPSSPPVDPSIDQVISPFVVTFSTTGTSNFEDNYDSAIDGQIVVP